MDEFSVLKERFNYIEDVLPKVINTDFNHYLLLSKEHKILKDQLVHYELIERLKSEIQSYEELLISTENPTDLTYIKSQIEDNTRLIQDAERLIQIQKEKKTESTAVVQVEPESKPIEDKVGDKELFQKRGKKDFKDSIKKIRGKDWSKLKSEWITALNVQFTPGDNINEGESISELPEFSAIEKDILFQEETVPLKASLNTLFEKELGIISREYILRSACYNFHKASHIIGAAEFHADNGLTTWSLSSAYQGALLAARSIINLLGVTYFSYNQNDYLIDVWNSYEVNGSYTKVGIIRYSYKIEHRHLWLLLKRMLNSFDVSIWDADFVKAIIDLDIESITKQRNYLNYWGHTWIFDDLFKYHFEDDFGVYPKGLQNGIKDFEFRSDFTLVFAQILLKLAYDLLYDLSEQTILLQTEIALAKSFISNTDRHPIYNRNKPFFKPSSQRD